MDGIPTISVIMAVYNGEKYLEKSISSILKQSFPEFEFIIINDGSTDSSAFIVEKFAKRDNRIRVFHQENCGLSRTLNRGIKLARGKYVARMDQDDISLGRRLEIQYARLEKGNKASLCHSLVNIINDNDNVAPFKKNVGLRLTPLQVMWTLLWCNCIRHPTVMMRRSLFLDHSLEYSHSALGCEDYELWCRLSKVTDLALIEQSLVLYREQPESITHKNGIDHMNSLGDIVSNNLKPYIGRVLDKGQRKELTILSGQTYLGRSYRSYHLSPAFFLGLIESVNKRFVELNRLDSKGARELGLASAKLCMRWAKTTFFSRTSMASKFMLAALEHAIRLNV